MYRQGDVLVIPTDRTPTGKIVPRDNGRVVLEYGEVTGHAHAIADPEAELRSDPDLEMRFLSVLADAGVELTHEEHGTIPLPPGDYEVRGQYEYTPEEIRRVAD